MPAFLLNIYYFPSVNTEEIIDQLKQLSNPAYLNGMQRFGIDNSRALGVKLPDLRKMAKGIKKDHQLALELWDTDIHEARILASLVDDPKVVTTQQMDSWVNDFASWDVCDQVCGQELTPREAGGGDREAQRIEAVLKVALDILAMR